MRILYIECKMGAAGDMLMGALYDLLPPADQLHFLEIINNLKLPGICVRAEDKKVCGISGKKMRVLVHGGEEEHHHGADHEYHHHHGGEEEHHHGVEHGHHHGVEHEHYHGEAHHMHNSYGEILGKIRDLPLKDSVKQDMEAVYRLIGEAESKVHKSDLFHIHFHEVGTLDALADVAGCCILMDMLNVDKVIVSPVCVGNGHVRCAHGILPVPAPATAEILKGMPMYFSSFDGELLTPTGAALLKHFADAFGECPQFIIEKTGYGLGSREYETANCVRMLLGQSSDTEYEDEVLEICCNLDDMTPEAMGALYEPLFELGALDVYTIPLGMKKCRSGWMFCVLCRLQDAETLQLFLLKHTTTQGIRFQKWNRKKLKTEFETVNTRYGDIRLKISSGYGIRKMKPEYEDVVRAAKSTGAAYHEVIQEVQKDKKLF